MNKINTNINTQNLLYISNPEFKIKKITFTAIRIDSIL